MTNQGFDYANFSMYNQFPFIMWHEFMGPSGAVQGLFKSQWDRNYAIDEDFRPLGYVNQLEGRKGDYLPVSRGCEDLTYSVDVYQLGWEGGGVELLPDSILPLLSFTGESYGFFL